MSEIVALFLGVIIGGAIVYFLKRHSKLSSLSAYTEDQQSKKQFRKEKILEIIREKGSVTNNDIETALGVSDASATNYLQELEREGLIEQIGERGRFVSYKVKKK